MTEHTLKIVSEFWDAVESNQKTFEIRWTGDRDFNVGDTLRLREWNEADAEAKVMNRERWTPEIGYTGREIRRQITYILRGERWGLMKDYVILAMKEIE